MKHGCRAARIFWRSWCKLPEAQQQAARLAFQVFKATPFDPRLKPPEIRKLTA
jgi:hypothetical protein